MAKKKYVWIHIDLDKADFVNKEELVRYDKDISGYNFLLQKLHAAVLLNVVRR